MLLNRVPEGAAHRRHADDDEDGDQGHDQRVFDGVGATLVAKKRHNVILKIRQYIESPGENNVKPFNQK